MWFTENPWPPIVFFCIAAAVFGVIWLNSQRVKHLLIALGLLVSTGLIFGLELIIVTEGERIEQHVLDLTSAFQKKDLDKTLGFFSTQNEKDRNLIKIAYGMVTIDDDLRVTDVIVEVKAENSLATSHFRANGTISVTGNSYTGHIPSRWLLSWRKEEGLWKITNTTRLHPIQNEEMQPLERRVQ